MVEGDTGCYTALHCAVCNTVSAVCGLSRALIKMLHSNKDRKIMALYSDYYQSYWGVTLTSPSKDYTSRPVLGRREMTAHYGVTAGVKVFHIKRISSRYYGKGEVRKIARMAIRANCFCVENLNFTCSCAKSSN